MKRAWSSIVVMAGVAALGCGADGGGGVRTTTGQCEDGARSSDNHYLPQVVGNQWRYRVTKLDTGAVTNKVQFLSEEFTPPGKEPVYLQVTVKSTGSTESWLRRVGDAVIRVQQQDLDPGGALKATTSYDPFVTRLDESAERIEDGAMWRETYQKVIVDAAGIEQMTETVTDEWTVLGVDVPCSTPFGEFECLEVRRRRVAGGTADKRFFFARGIGKVREQGSQLEELIGCELE